MLDFYAHSENKQGKKDLIINHSLLVAKRASFFAKDFGAQDEAYITGLLHDLGKYGDLFQRRLKGLETGIDHWSAGAWEILMRLQNNGLAGSLAIQGHHIGLQICSKDSLASIQPEYLKKNHPLKLRLSCDNYTLLKEGFKNDGLEKELNQVTISQSIFAGLLNPKCASDMMDIRMLYSALVDADFIETSNFFNPDKSEYQYKNDMELNPEKGLEVLNLYTKNLSKNSKASQRVLTLRSILYQNSLESADDNIGIFTLSAPTGSGKTLSMLAFALQHAIKNNLIRIIFVIPYLNIIDQTASRYRDVFRNIVGQENLNKYLLEIHSMSSAQKEEKTDQNDLNLNTLIENWNAPIIITTNVQFLESLFSNRPSSCRKLHNFANSIILFDEAQSIPSSLAIPTLATLTRFPEKYHSSIVFSTATQPAFEKLNSTIVSFGNSGWNPKKIIKDEKFWFSMIKRIKTYWPKTFDEITTWKDLSNELSQQQEVLCIVNLKKHAIQLFRSLANTKGSYHLSTNMCPKHRLSVLAKVIKAMSDKEPCRLISTQCVEAGVDIDFPVVYRSWGPLDSIAQAAGRCNRNGNLEMGEMHIIIPEEDKYPDPNYQQAADVTRILAKEVGIEKMDIESPEIFDKYYSKLFDINKPENSFQELQTAIKGMDFPAVAKLYHIIPKNTINILVPYNIEIYRKLSVEAEQEILNKAWITKARDYCVSIFKPSSDNPINAYLKPLRMIKDKISDEWFIYLKEDGYDKDIGLIQPESTNCWIG